MKKITFIALAAILLASCKENGTPVTTSDKENNYRVVKLFEIDGISVYRFNDCGTWVYFTNGNGKVHSKRTRSHYNPGTKTTMTETKTTETICNNNE